MCLASAVRVISIEADAAVVELDGRLRRASLVRHPEIAVGDWALVAAGSVIRRLEADEAAEIVELLQATGPARARTTPVGGPS